MSSSSSAMLAKTHGSAMMKKKEESAVFARMDCMEAKMTDIAASLANIVESQGQLQLAVVNLANARGRDADVMEDGVDKPVNKRMRTDEPIDADNDNATLSRGSNECEMLRVQLDLSDYVDAHSKSKVVALMVGKGIEGGRKSYSKVALKAILKNNWEKFRSTVATLG
jgi:hypothetical protein